VAGKVRKLRGGIAAAALLAAAACRSGEQPVSKASQAPPRTAARPNVLFISIDTIRADHCSAYGYAYDTTPRLARLAAEGARALEAYAPMATTGPSHATMLTSLYPLTHGVVKNGYVLAAEHVTLAERLKAKGYETTAILSSVPLAAKFGLNQGFDRYDDDFGPRRRRADVTTALATGWLRSRSRDRPFLLWVHFFDPHSPYDPPREFRGLVRPALTPVPKPGRDQEVWKYDGEIRFADDGMGKLLDALDELGLRDGTLVVVVGDHGEGLGDHGHMKHGLLIYEEAVRVPLVFRYPGKLRGAAQLTGPIPLVDLTPTILDLTLGAEAREGLQGESQLPALLGLARSRSDRRVFLQRRFYDPESHGGLKIAGEKFAVRVGSWKYLVAEEEKTRELYDLAADPGELTNVADQHPEKVRDLDAALADWRKSQKGAKRQVLSPEDAERLKALGYVQ
jgi:arylsulfatase A-like enzyme